MLRPERSDRPKHLPRRLSGGAENAQPVLMGAHLDAEEQRMVDATIPLSDALAEPNGLTPNDATLRFVGRIKVTLNRLWLHAWPWWFVAGIGLFAVLGRAGRSGRLDFTLPMLLVVMSITTIVCLVVVRRVVVSEGAQLALVALPPDAVALLGVNYRLSAKDRGGAIPRHPLVASEAGLQIHMNGSQHDRPTLRERGISVELSASRSGLLSGCVLCLDERRVPVRVRGRLQLKHPVSSAFGDRIRSTRSP